MGGDPNVDDLDNSFFVNFLDLKNRPGCAGSVVDINEDI